MDGLPDADGRLPGDANRTREHRYVQADAVPAGAAAVLDSVR